MTSDDSQLFGGSFNDILSVSQLNKLTRELIDISFPLVWIEGEISNLARPASGHWYFTLKDQQAQVRCAMFRMRNKGLGFIPDNGMHVVARAKVGFYELRGEFQLVIEQLEETGTGALRRQFELLKQKLAGEGLFDQAKKREIPVFPHKLGVVTSPSGAAIKDVLSVIERRFPALEIVIYPTLVQGEEAPQAIATMLKIANQRKECDILLITRGGGSLEDLWAFNSELVARAISDSSIPVVSGIGHEIDITIADFVADIRAATPSAAAELISPNRADWLESVSQLYKRLSKQIAKYLENKNQQLQWLSKRVVHPRNRLQALSQRMDELEQRLLLNQRHLLRHRHARFNTLSTKMTAYSPHKKLTTLNMQYRAYDARLRTAINHLYDRKKSIFSLQTKALETISPLATLSRGYAIVKRKQDNHIIVNANEAQPGKQIIAQLHKGELLCTVDKIKKN